MPWFPDAPDGLPRGEVTSHFRYEDVAQDGRVRLTSIPTAVGPAVWEKLLADHPIAHTLARAGVLAPLTRMTVEGGEGSVSVSKPIHQGGTYQLAHSRDSNGDVDRLYFLVWVSTTAPSGRTHQPPPPDAGRTILVGRAFIEHVFTRPFAPPGQRKVLRFEAEGLPEVPAARYQPPPIEEILALPEGAVPLDEAMLPDEAPIAYGLMHTDSNQHVNSMVYPRLFEEAVLRRLQARGVSTGALLSRNLEIAYRKPSFAGQRARILLRAYRLGEKYGAVATFMPDDDSAAKPSVLVRGLLG